jgi:hypothetical protein
MSFLSFTAWQFAAAGAILATAPVIIHLLNRRRYRVVHWAAMDFLKEAMQRNRKMLQLRDIILLIMRTIAVFLFGLVLARPFFARGGNSAVDERQPLHAILVVDNSLSMGYEGLDGSLLDKAKDRARRLIDQLPAGSKISVLPACGSREGYSPDPYDTKDSALDAIGKLELVDRSASMLRAMNDVQRASESFPDLAKRVVVFSDQQASNWRDVRSTEALAKLQDWQLVTVAPASATADSENTWIADLRVQDGLADIETPTTITVVLQHQGGIARQDIPVKLSYGDTVIGEKTVAMEPGAGTKEVEFEYVFNTLTELPEPDRPLFVPLKAEVQVTDSLAADNERFLSLPIVAGLPVVFIDQFGAAEDPLRNQLGETRHLRKLLAPKTSRSDAPRQLVKVSHLAPQELNQEAIQDARLVVIAGLREPPSEEAVTLLRDYVRQGGRLVIAAGVDFDPARWQELAWRDGDGILPLPLTNTIGEVPEVAGANTRPFYISFDSLSGDELFQLAAIGETELRDLYSEPFFFKAVGTDASPESLVQVAELARQRIEAELTFLQGAEARQAAFAAKQATGEVSAADQAELQEDELKLAQLQPQWLTWSNREQASFGAAAFSDLSLPGTPDAVAQRVAALAQQEQPRVLARFDNPAQSPFLVTAKKGHGEVLFVATGLLSSWNTLPKTNAILIFDRLLRTMTRSTLPRRNFAPLEQLTLPVPSNEHDLAVTLARPRQLDPEPLDIGFISGDVRGFTLHGLFQRGVYRVAGYRRDPAAEGPQPMAEKPAWEIPLVVNGDAAESELQPLSRERFEELTAGSSLRWVEPGEDISLAGAAIRGQSSWWYLALAVLLLLLAEMLVLAWPSLRPQVAAA